MASLILESRQIPLRILSTGPEGQSVLDRKILLKTRELHYRLDVTKPWKVNAGAAGVCSCSSCYL